MRTTVTGDIRHALRLAGTKPGYTALLIATMVLGLGTSTAMFSVVHGVLLQEPPYPEPDRVVSIEPTPRDGRRHFSPPDFIDFTESTSSFEAIAAIQGHGPATLTVGGQSMPIQVREVTTDVLAVYGVRPIVGRAFERADEDTLFTDRAAAERDPGAILIGQRLWQEQFASEASVLGRLVQIDFQPFEIVGVLPTGFDTLIPDEGDYRTGVDVWQLTRMNLRAMPRDAAFLRVVARLQPRTTIGQAGAEAGAFAARQRAAHAVHRDGGYEVRVESLHASLTRRFGASIAMLFGAVVVLLVIACANLGTLQLTRSVARQREFSVRLALGASRGRLARQLLIENTLYGLTGAALALVAARWLVRGLVQLAPAAIPRLDDVQVSGSAFAFAVSVALAASAAVAMLPVLRLSRSREAAVLQTSRGTLGVGRQAGDRTFAIAQIALSVILLIGSALVVRSLSALLEVDPGFRAAQVLTADFELTASRYPRYPRADARVRFARQLTDRVNALPGVEAAALALVVPLSRQDAGHTFASEAMAAAATTLPAAKYRPITPGYFRAAGTELVAGRDFDWHDLEQDRLVTIVDAGLAARAWPGEEPIGKRLRIERWAAGADGVRLEPLWTEVIGVAERVRSGSLRQDDIETVYLPYGMYAVAELSLLVRTASDPLAFADAVRREAAAVDGDVVLRMQPMTSIVAGSVAAERFTLILLATFAVAGLALSLLGLYGVVSQFVGLRRQEIGIRIAIGAQRHEVRYRFLQQARSWPRPAS